MSTLRTVRRHADVMGTVASIHVHDDPSLVDPRLVDDAIEGPRCDTASSGTLTFEQSILIRDVAARAEPGRLWLAVIAENSGGPFTPQVRGARVEGGKLVKVHATSLEDGAYPDEVDYTTQSF